MLPVSYWPGSACARAFGARRGVAPLVRRLACVATAATLIYGGARRASVPPRAGRRACSSRPTPGVVVIAVRSAVYLLFLLGVGPRPTPWCDWPVAIPRPGRGPPAAILAGGPRRLLATTAATHFYGVVLAGAALTPMAALDPASPVAAGTGVGGLRAVVVAAPAILPFVRIRSGSPGRSALPGPVPLPGVGLQAGRSTCSTTPRRWFTGGRGGVLAGAPVLAVAGVAVSGRAGRRRRPGGRRRARGGRGSPSWPWPATIRAGRRRMTASG